MSGFLAQILIRQVVLFGLTGVLSTFLDFFLYNRLTPKLSRILANVCSTSVAMAFSFTVNLVLVFQPDIFRVPERAIKFVLVTAFSLYVVQNVVIYITSKLWLGPVRMACAVAQRLDTTKKWSEEFIGKNTVKVLATIFSMIWNFFWYKYFVYRD
jgi:putative flippase GtrA